MSNYRQIKGGKVTIQLVYLFDGRLWNCRDNNFQSEGKYEVEIIRNCYNTILNKGS